MTSFATEAGLPARLTPTALSQPATKPAILIMMSFATELATPSVTDVWTPYHI